MLICPVCETTLFRVVASEQRLREECHIRERFVSRRLTAPANPDEMKDLTDFFHTERADLLQCEICTLLVRVEHEPPPTGYYSDDEYDSSVIDHQYPYYLEAFRKKENIYRHLLPEGARVLEIGSHYGAFLQTATEWDWQVEGVDPGKDTGRFARSKGFRVHIAALEDCAFPAEEFDGIFIWNCFEQIADPKPTLVACRRLLKIGGLLTVRVPNGEFYTICETLRRDPQVTRESKEFVIRAMGYNNLLGFPYLYGHNQATLQRLIEPRGFSLQGVVNSELIRFPLPLDPLWVECEEKEISRELRLLSNSMLAGRGETLTAPWIEAWFRTA